MRFAFTDEQEEFRRSTRRFLEKHATTDHTRATMETESGRDGALWVRLCNELGAAGLTILERFGGFGFGMVEHVAVMEVAGRDAALLTAARDGLPDRGAPARECERQRWFRPRSWGATPSPRTQSVRSHGLE